MPQTKESKGQSPASTPNIQDVFLNYARRERLAVIIRMVDGSELQGRIKNFDRFALIVEHNGADHMIFKHAIATIKSPRTIGNYWPYASTLFDYIRRAMPLSSPGTLTADEVYSVTAWLLAANEILPAGASLDSASLVAVQMPARDRFRPDDRRGGPEVR